MTGIDATRISVILPNHNHAQYLPDSLDALAKQTWKNFEVLVVDDASTDSSCELIEDWCKRDARFKLIRLAHNVGINAAVKHGLERAQGAYLYLAAADDLILPDFLEKSVSMLVEHPTAAFCFSDPSEWRSGDDVIVFPLYLSAEPRCYTKEQFANLLRRNFFNVSANTILYRRSSFEDAGGYLEELGWLSDWFASTLTSLRHGACYLPGCYTRLRLRTDSYSAVNLRNTSQHRQLIAHVFAHLQNQKYDDVRHSLRLAAVIPEYRLRMLWWLLSDRNSWSIITGRLLLRVLWRGVWHHARNSVPPSARRALRRRSSVHAAEKFG